MYALDFTTEHYDALQEALLREYAPEYIEQNRGAIKEAIIQIFADTHQEVNVSFIQGTLHIEKAFLYPQKGEQLDRLLHKVTMRLLTVEDNPSVFKPVEYLWILPEEIRSDLFHYFKKLKMEIREVREYIRERIVEVFGLQEKDIVLFLRNAVYILHYIPPSVVTDGVERRFGGLPPHEMEKLFDTLFPDGAWDLIEGYLDGIFTDQLDFTQIDNQTFRDTFIPIFKSMIEILIVEYASQIDADKVEGFVGFVLRKYFDDILIAAAWEVLALFQERDRNAEQFIRYFQDEIIINEKGKKVQKYAIIDEMGQKWNHNSILSILLQYEQAVKREKNQNEKIEMITQRLEESKMAFSAEKDGRFRVSTEVKESQTLVIQNQNMIDKLEHRIEDLKENTDENHEQLRRLKKERERLLERSRMAHNNADYATRRFNNKQIDMKNWEKQYHANIKLLEEINEQNESLMQKMELIVKGLAIAMAKR